MTKKRPPTHLTGAERAFLRPKIEAQLAAQRRPDVDALAETPRLRQRGLHPNQVRRLIRQEVDVVEADLNKAKMEAEDTAAALRAATDNAARLEEANRRLIEVDMRVNDLQQAYTIAQAALSERNEALSRINNDESTSAEVEEVHANITRRLEQLNKERDEGLEVHAAEKETIAEELAARTKELQDVKRQLQEQAGKEDVIAKLIKDLETAQAKVDKASKRSSACVDLEARIYSLKKLSKEQEQKLTQEKAICERYKKQYEETKEETDGVHRAAIKANREARQLEKNIALMQQEAAKANERAEQAERLLRDQQTRAERAEYFLTSFRYLGIVEQRLKSTARARCNQLELDSLTVTIAQKHVASEYCEQYSRYNDRRDADVGARNAGADIENDMKEWNRFRNQLAHEPSSDVNASIEKHKRFQELSAKLLALCDQVVTRRTRSIDVWTYQPSHMRRI